MTNKLISHIETTDPSTLEDLILVMAINVEASLINAGAKPGEDYSIRDLWNWATPYALDVFKNKEMNISYRTGS